MAYPRDRLLQGMSLQCFEKIVQKYFAKKFEISFLKKKILKRFFEKQRSNNSFAWRFNIIWHKSQKSPKISNNYITRNTSYKYLMQVMPNIIL